MTDYAYSQWGYAENDIYYLEVCTLNEMCSNYEEILSSIRVIHSQWAPVKSPFKTASRYSSACFSQVSSDLPPDGFSSPAQWAGVFFTFALSLSA